MTFIKSLLLGSAAGIVAVASAQAADLPTKKAAPVEYVRVCNVGGITGWTLPGSDTCVKFSGYITAQFEGGNLKTQYNQAGFATVANVLPATDPGLPRWPPWLAGRALRAHIPTSAAFFHAAHQRSALQRNSTFYRDHDRLDDPRQLRLRHGLEHRLRAPDRAFRYQLGNGQTASTTPARPLISTPGI